MARFWFQNDHQAGDICAQPVPVANVFVGPLDIYLTQNWSYYHNYDIYSL